MDEVGTLGGAEITEIIQTEMRRLLIKKLQLPGGKISGTKPGGRKRLPHVCESLDGKL